MHRAASASCKWKVTRDCPWGGKNSPDTWPDMRQQQLYTTIDFGWTRSGAICRILQILDPLAFGHGPMFSITNLTSIHFRGSRSSWKTQWPCRQREGKSSPGSSFLCQRSLPRTNSFPGKQLKDFIKSGLRGPFVRLWWITLILENSKQVVIPKSCVTSRISVANLRLQSSLSFSDAQHWHCSSGRHWPWISPQRFNGAWANNKHDISRQCQSLEKNRSCVSPGPDSAKGVQL